MHTMRPKSVHTKGRQFYGLLMLMFLAGLPKMNATCIYSSTVEAKEVEVGVLLSWSTLQEVENEIFAVQKSLDGIDFITEGVVRSVGNSEQENHYRYLDISAGQEKVYYRLVDIDKKGTFAYSETIVFRRTNQNDLLISTMSSTVTDRFFTLTLQSSVEKTIDYKVVDKSNHQVKAGQARVVQGSNAISFDMSDLEAGKYKLVINAGREEETVYLQKNKSGEKPKLNFALKENP